jgi:hypothetical protein
MTPHFASRQLELGGAPLGLEAATPNVNGPAPHLVHLDELAVTTRPWQNAFRCPPSA